MRKSFSLCLLLGLFTLPAGAFAQAKNPPPEDGLSKFLGGINKSITQASDALKKRGNNLATTQPGSPPSSAQFGDRDDAPPARLYDRNQYDITGLRLGMTWTEAKAILEKKKPSQLLTYSNLDAARATNIPTAFVVRYLNTDLSKKAESREEYLISVYPKSVGADPSNWIVHKISRAVSFFDGKLPTKESVVRNLVRKYGPANDKLDGSAMMLIWLPRQGSKYDEQAILSKETDLTHNSKCQLPLHAFRDGINHEVFEKKFAACGLVNTANFLYEDQTGLVVSVSQDLFDFDDVNMVAQAKKTVAQQLDAQTIAKNKAAAPSTNF